MKNKFLSLLFLFSLYLTSSYATPRTWTNQGADNGTVHSLGNGKMLVYGQGPQIIKIYPSPYTSPSLYNLLLDEKKPVTVTSSRKKGTAVWEHEISSENDRLASMIDYVDPELPVMIRHLEIKASLTFRLELAQGISVMEDRNAGTTRRSLLLRTKPGALIYQNYVYPNPIYHEIRLEGGGSIERSQEEENVYYLTCSEGIMDILLIGGPDYSSMIMNREEIMMLGHHELLNRTEAWWQDFTQRRYPFDEKLPTDLPLRQELLQIIDDVSVMIRTQQATEGAVMAGYPYPLGYVRDQYGVSRGYLALGYFEEAKNILEFYHEIWRKTGELHCAQGIGVDGIFHIHENDEVESPGYLILQAFDLLEKTGDNDFIEELTPMLEWCWEVQKKHLAGNMLPFNGDETYVAGGILPRSALNDGSAEATLLFIEGGERFMQWLETTGKWSREKISSERKIIKTVKDDYRKNFWKNKQLITNNPDRLDHIEAPRFRHGVCERGGPECLVYGRVGFGGIDWTEKDENGRYQCANCIALGSLPAADKTIFNLLTVSLTPQYFQSDLFTPKEIKPVLEKIYTSYQATGVLTSRTEGLEKNNNRSVGYDYGLVLFNMMKTNSPGSEDIYRKTISIADETGAWSEYYLGTAPSGTRCRPWESAINLEALIEFAKP